MVTYVHFHLVYFFNTEYTVIGELIVRMYVLDENLPLMTFKTVSQAKL